MAKKNAQSISEKKVGESISRLTTALKSGADDHQIIASIIDDPKQSENWTLIVEKLEEELLSLVETSFRARINQIIGDIARDKIKDEAIAVKHYLAAARLGQIDSSAFSFLRSRLLRQHAYVQLREMCFLKLGKHNYPEQRELIFDLLNLPLALDLADREYFSLALLQMNEKDIDPILDVMVRYVKQFDVPKIKKLAVRIGEIGMSSAQVRLLVDHLVELLLRLDDADSQRVAAEILMQQEDFQGSTALENQTLQTELAKKLLVEPDPARILTISASLARYRPLTLHELNRLKKYADTEERRLQLLGIFETQLSQKLPRDVRHFVLREAAEIASLDPQKKMIVRKYFLEAREVAANRADASWDYIRFLYGAGFGEESQKEQKDYLNSDQVYVNSERTELICARLIAEGGDSLFVRDTLTKKIKEKLDQWAADEIEDPSELCGRLADILVVHDLADLSVRRASLRGAIMRSDMVRSYDLAQQLFRALQSKQEINDELGWLGSLISKVQTDISFEGLCAHVAKSFLNVKISGEIATEALIRIGSILYRSDLYASETLAIYRHLGQRLLMLDERTWIPAFYAFKDFGTPLECSQHLQLILPLLEKNPHPLREYAITIEALRNESQQREDRLNYGRPARENQQKSTVSPLPELVTSVDDRIREKKNKPEDLLTPEAVRASSFKSEVERHVVFQSACLRTGQIKELEDWHWKVWRHPEQCGYPRVGKGRYPQTRQSKALLGPLHQVLILLGRSIVMHHRLVFQRGSLVNPPMQSHEQVDLLAKQLSWSHPIFYQTSLAYLLPTMRERRMTFFNYAGLKERIFYEGESRRIYLDADEYLKRPPSIIFHRIGALLWSLNLGYFPALQVHAQDLLAFLQTIQQRLVGEKLTLAKNIISHGFETKSQLLAGADEATVKALLSRIKKIDLQTVEEIQSEMQQHVYRLILAESLDLVGIVESMLGEDVFNLGVNVKDICEKTPEIQHLLGFAQKLVFA